MDELYFLRVTDPLAQYRVADSKVRSEPPGDADR
jgi:hypothetical protein